MKKLFGRISYFFAVIFGFRRNIDEATAAKVSLARYDEIINQLNKIFTSIEFATNSNVKNIQELTQTIRQRPLSAFLFTTKGIAVNLSVEKKAQFEVEYVPLTENLLFKLVIDYTKVIETLNIDLVRLSKQDFEDKKYAEFGRVYLSKRRAGFTQDIAVRAMAKTIIRSQSIIMDASQLLTACGESFIESSKAFASYDERTKQSEDKKSEGLRIVVDKDSPIAEAK